jgi:hypothetical protein
MKGPLAGLLAVLMMTPVPAAAHHGVASLGAAGLEGPGAPIETSSSATLPKGGVLTYLKLDYASFEKFTDARDDETDYYTFWLLGVGYGITPYLSTYLFVPYNDKVVENNSFNTSGFADLSLLGVFGFKYDEGLRIIPPTESIDDLQDWHFTVYGGLSLPTGNPNVRNAEGNIDPTMSLGFGKPAFSVGLTATKAISDPLTFVAETSYIYFEEYRYSDGNEGQFGDEFRFNSALCYRLLTRADAKLRLDANLEANYLYLGRDKTNGVPESATGGDILYLAPGMRVYWKNISVGMAVKVPTLTDLNEEDDQQGSEGTENYRLIFTFSAIL